MNAPQRRPASTKRTASAANFPLLVDVEWGDISLVDGPVLMAGKYMGVLPQRALLSLDRLVSGLSGKPGESDRLVLGDLTRRGAIRSAIGDVDFFPCPGGRQVVLVGMGHLGSFSTAQLAKAARCAAETVGRLMPGTTVCTVLIGTGARNMTVADSVEGLLSGFCGALRSDPTLHFERLRIVERSLLRAYEIAEALVERAKDPRFRAWVEVAPEVVERDGGGGEIPRRFGFSLMLASIAQACNEGEGSALYASAQALLDKLPEGLRETVHGELKTRGAEADLRRAGLKFRIREDRVANDRPSADRVSFFQDGRQVRSTAMTNLATVTERILPVKCDWIERIVDDLYAADLQRVEDRSRSAFNDLVHPDIREKVAVEGPLVVEVDPRLARVPWEMLQDGTPGSKPLAVRRPVARQLRTVYSPRVLLPSPTGHTRALVIGDPEESLPAAHEEAKAVYRLLKDGGIDTTLCLGSPNEIQLGRHSIDGTPIDSADLFRVVERLQSGEYDLVHFSGHAAFSAKEPDMSGWIFAGDEVLTAAMLENVERPPALIFANACLSGALATADRRLGDPWLVASLADEFLRRGVADYVGTAWLVPDEPARDFAQAFYRTLLNAAGVTLGEALREARERLYDARAQGADWQPAWAAYQHYGDPGRPFPPATGARA